jgi:hypothetical protein
MVWSTVGVSAGWYDIQAGLTSLEWLSVDQGLSRPLSRSSPAVLYSVRLIFVM